MIGTLFPRPVHAAPVVTQPVCALAVDAEEDFDWDSPVASTDYSTRAMRNVGVLQEIAGAYGLKPTYLLTYPVLQDETAVAVLRHLLGRDQCAVGVQLHPWVTPPLQQADDLAGVHGASFSGNLPEGLEEEKLLALNTRFAECFGMPPRIYRAGRYGLGRNTPAMLERHGFLIDTSIAPRTDFRNDGGPDFRDLDYHPFWFGTDRRLLEVPLCRSVVGWGASLAPALYRQLEAPLPKRLRLPAIAARLRLAERITLSPEGNDTAAMLRLVRHLLARGQKVLVLSFHSSSLAIGRNPYVRTRADLHQFYDRLSAVLDAMASRFNVRFASLADLPDLLREP